MKHPFSPTWNSKTRILILGTFPSIRSIEDHIFYGHPQNAFWRIIGEILEAKDYRNLTHHEKLRRLAKYDIALWDVIVSCDRASSADAQITNEIYLDFAELKNQCPNLEIILFNSKFMLQTKKRRDLVAQLTNIGIDHEFLPSTSPAYPLRYELKLKVWTNALEHYFHNTPLEALKPTDSKRNKRK